ncbi:uncharacterized protein LOC144151057 [Haemaphysalis longicornis]
MRAAHHFLPQHSSESHRTPASLPFPLLSPRPTQRASQHVQDHAWLVHHCGHAVAPVVAGGAGALGWPSDRTRWDTDARDLLALHYLSGGDGSSSSSGRPAWPKRALSLFAHWRPQYSTGGDEPEMPSEISRRPHALPLRWG